MRHEPPRHFLTGRPDWPLSGVPPARWSRAGDGRRALGEIVGAQVNGVAAATALFGPLFDRPAAGEQLWVAQLDAGGRLLALDRHEGEPAAIDLPLRAILADALAHDSAGVMIAHDHPGGDPAPSPADRRGTRRLADALAAIEVVLVDHLITARDEDGRRRWHSFRREGML